MKFIVDSMLGKLAKYLRFLGYDTLYPDNKVTDNEIIETAKKENRILITRDREMASRYEKSFLIRSLDSMEQLKIIVKTFNLNSDHLLSRCSICNTELIKINKEKVKGKVPENVYKNFNEFFVCPSCGRYYWFGSHAQKIENTLKMVEKNENI
ncbi:MAG: DUF5615 family PIN-like protein [Thermoplasmata archaeon]|mgnify:CR=1 FL=1|nr:Mut7-C RNAse domain-containing protein [Thermoplasmata archaeon]